MITRRRAILNDTKQAKKRVLTNAREATKKTERDIKKVFIRLVMKILIFIHV